MLHQSLPDPDRWHLPQQQLHAHVAAEQLCEVVVQHACLQQWKTMMQIAFAPPTHLLIGLRLLTQAEVGPKVAERSQEVGRQSGTGLHRQRVIENQTDCHPLASRQVFCT